MHETTDDTSMVCTIQNHYTIIITNSSIFNQAICGNRFREYLLKPFYHWLTWAQKCSAQVNKYKLVDGLDCDRSISGKEYPAHVSSRYLAGGARMSLVNLGKGIFCYMMSRR